MELLKLDLPEQTHIVEENKNKLQINNKRKCDDDRVPAKKRINTGETAENELVTTKDHVKLAEEEPLENILATTSKEKKQKPTTNFVPQSPKKRLELQVLDKKSQKKKEKFIYGNYSQYYGYRNKDKDFHDIRLDVFEKYKDLFKNKRVLDIGCNTGFITMEIAKRFEVKSMVGLDIDKHLINQAIKTIIKHKKSLSMNNELKRLHKFPFNVTFVQGNYVLRDSVLLEIERTQFDVILCLSITKWIHLNFGDDGLKMAFKRMFLQLHSKGVLVLEAQPFDNYGRRKKMTVSKSSNSVICHE